MRYLIVVAVCLFGGCAASRYDTYWMGNAVTRVDGEFKVTTPANIGLRDDGVVVWK